MVENAKQKALEVHRRLTGQGEAPPHYNAEEKKTMHRAVARNMLAMRRTKGLDRYADKCRDLFQAQPKRWRRRRRRRV